MTGLEKKLPLKDSFLKELLEGIQIDRREQFSGIRKAALDKLFALGL